jgi:hypothetical protein
LTTNVDGILSHVTTSNCVRYMLHGSKDEKHVDVKWKEGLTVTLPRGVGYIFFFSIFVKIAF